MITKVNLNRLKNSLDGSLLTDKLHQILYATDASVYRQLPLGVAYPKNIGDLKKIISYCNLHEIPIIPRAAGTSLAGQCVGEGLIIDISKYFTNVLSLDTQAKTVKVEPGIIRDELNMYLKPYGLFFGPNTSTSNRCMIGGMVGNNSSGSTSIKYGVTRDKVIALDLVLADGSLITLKDLSPVEYKAKLSLDSLEGEVYRFIDSELSKEETRKEIRSGYPDPKIHRRNTGYAIDALLDMDPFSGNGTPYNLSKLLAGSEGTLGFIAGITLELDALPPVNDLVIAAHFNSVADCCSAVYEVMQHDLYACEMMDKVILDCTKSNKGQLPNRFFIEGDPQAILLLELRNEDLNVLETQKASLLKLLEEQRLAYAYPVLYGEDTEKAFELRKAGLGLLGNLVGDRKAVACIEDTAVNIKDLSDYIREFSGIMDNYGQNAVYYAHAGAGELHLRPILDLKISSDVKMFRQITTDVANLVKKYGGVMSGEHGEGRVRSEFIELMIGSKNLELLKRLKSVFDPKGIFNPGKIVHAVKMDADLRYETDRDEPEIETFLDFSDSEGVLRAAERCNGSGDCRKSHLSNGAMCPSYHATRDEKDTTRARANTLREILTTNTHTNRFNDESLKQVFDLCLSCKACASECPSGVDAAAFKSELLYQYHKENGASIRDRAFAYNTQLNKISLIAPALVQNKLGSYLLKRFLGVAEQRNLPKTYRFDFDKYLESRSVGAYVKKEIILYIDEFTRYMDVRLGKDAIDLFTGLGYSITLFYGESGRSFISKGFLEQAKKCADENILNLKKLIKNEIPVIGLEPSAILTFRDEYLRMAEDLTFAKNLAKNSFLAEEFLAAEKKAGVIDTAVFTDNSKEIKYHVHCHQKSLSDIKCTFDILSLPANYKVTMINAGCCGMAGSFGYESEHYEVSMKIGEQRLFPAVRKAPVETIIAANGTSCRHQIKDGTSRDAKHPIQILKEALV
ncbi:FAD-binding and (Fe-S)-binding domain-containing protein [Robertkochia solimangrovi]|uniref:FAD-binding and (Fe-S)-binding domain-containing protein n=1 Tax=Robertkochia solimangrovi TaxID=2213046 RepID=UPI00117E93FC|nr:FAD-binding and (Fe-S)-binding domain-containing protein [Robertkochia solimangrovi]TRZ45297.1 FAD-binding oxidoreductase [Robertkochia solimangrovi]